MKLFTTLVAVAALFINFVSAEEAKSLVTLTVKRQVLDSNHEMHGRQGDTQSKTFTLRVELVNTSSNPILDAKLTGAVLISRTTATNDKMVREALGPITMPPIKANESFTVDLGKVTLREVDLKNRKFEEKMEEWKVDCIQNGSVIGSAASSEQFAAKEKEVSPAPAKKPGPNRQQAKKQNARLVE